MKKKPLWPIILKVILLTALLAIVITVGTKWAGLDLPSGVIGGVCGTAGAVMAIFLTKGYREQDGES
ncbi:MAG: hypothetical protein AAF514_04465 [Verrucomicrobiota bacterium]